MIFIESVSIHWDFPGGALGKEPPANAGGTRDVDSIPGLGMPWRRVQQPTAVFLPKESHGQRSLPCYGPWGHKESDTTAATLHAHPFTKSDDMYGGLLR